MFTISSSRFENEWSLMKNASTTKNIKMSSLSPKHRASLSNEILQLGDPLSKTEATVSSKRIGRKTKAPQARALAIS